MFGLVRGAVSLATAVGVGAVVNNAIAKTTPEQVSKLGRASLWVGKMVIGGVALKLCHDYINGQMDEIEGWFKVEPAEKQQ